MLNPASLARMEIRPYHSRDPSRETPMRPRPAVLLLLGLALAACGDYSKGYEPSDDTTATVRADLTADLIPNRYIVTLRPGVNAASESARLAAAAGGRVLFVYQHALSGFAAEIPSPTLLALGSDAAVATIEPDRRVTLQGVQTPAGSWGLDRIDQRTLPLDNAYNYDNGAPQVRIYIIDTGILTTHAEFKTNTGGTRATAGYSSIRDGKERTDCNGHGTHMAGLAGGRTYGVAKQVKLVSVRVLGCTGSGATSGVIAGVDWVTSRAVKPAVANMSLGATTTPTLTQAVTNSINSGVVYTVAAGGSSSNACGFSPADTPNALTVGASDNLDSKYSPSNFGPCLDLFAPGVALRAAWYTSTTATQVLSGSSTSAALVSGAAAIYLQAHPTASALTANAAITGNATSGVLTNIGVGSPNLLLYTVGLGF